MEYLSERIKSLSVSQTIAMDQKSRELKAKGIDIISLSLGEPDFNTPDYIKEAAKKAIDDNYSRYPPVPGYQDLREAISRKFRKDNGIEYAPEQIIVSAGGKHSLINVILSIVNPGDEVILLAPYWVSYYDQVILAGGKPVVVHAGLESDFKISPRQLEAAITDRTRLVIFNSPSNPTGMVYSHSEMEQIARVIEGHEGLFIISDEIYEHIIYEGEHASMASFDFIYDRVITINGVSKGYAMTGWRIGYLGAPLWITKACNKLQGQFTSGCLCHCAEGRTCRPSGGWRIPEGNEGCISSGAGIWYAAFLKEIEGMKVTVPQGAFYVMPDISYYFGKSDGEATIANSGDMALYLLDKARVATVGGDAFGSPECIRISYATSDELLTEAISRIRTALGRLH